MEPTIKEVKPITNEQLASYVSQLVGRVQLMSQLGMQYGGDRDIYKALGYPTGEIKYQDFYSRYIRQDMAKAVIDRPVRATWQGPLELVESDVTEDTPFEEAWDALNRTLGLKTKLARLDRLTGIGRYGVLLLGLDDVSNRSGFAKPVKEGTRKLMYVKPFGEKSAVIKEFEKDPKNPRYGQPSIYTIEVADIDNGASAFVDIHYSRVIHVTDEPLESDIYGTPRLEAVYNRLMDLEKLVGGDAEMFWRGARPGYEGKVDPEYAMTDEMKESLQDQISEYENNLRRFLINEGIELKSLSPQVADPGQHVDVQIQMISAVTGIPKRILTGTERGELASTQDNSEWKDYVQARREDHAEPNIIRPLVDCLIKLNILPLPKEDYAVKWNDLYSLSEKAKVEIGKARANALREYTYSPMSEAIVPPDAFFDLFLGLSTEQITLIRKQRDDMISQEELYDKILEELEPEPVIAPAAAGTTPVKKPMVRKPTTPKKP